MIVQLVVQIEVKIDEDQLIVVVSSEVKRTRPQFSTFVRKITLIIDISSIPLL